MTVSVGGMVVNPGDIVVGDQDGVLAVLQEDAAAAIEKARARRLWARSRLGVTTKQFTAKEN